MITDLINEMNNITLTKNNTFPGIENKKGLNNFATHNHIHNQWSLSYVVNGDTDVSIGTETTRLSSGQFISIPPEVPHLCSPKKDLPFSFEVLYIPCEFLRRAGRLFNKILIGKCSISTIHRLINYFLGSSTEEELFNSVNALAELLDNSDTLFPEALTKTASLNIYKNINDEWNSNISSRYQRYHRSRKKYGIGTKQVDIIQRIEKAKELLNKSDQLADIAIECGFYDQSHFTKTFKQYTGLTPAQYNG